MLHQRKAQIPPLRLVRREFEFLEIVRNPASGALVKLGNDEAPPVRGCNRLGCSFGSIRELVNGRGFFVRKLVRCQMYASSALSPRSVERPEGSCLLACKRSSSVGEWACEWCELLVGNTRWPLCMVGQANEVDIKMESCHERA